MSPTVNRDFAGYRIVRPLELGPRASVWEAESIESGDSVAIETLAGEAAVDPDVREWFTEAWAAVAEIDHPRLVSVAELGEQDGVPFAVRTPPGARTLAKLLGVGGPLEPERAAALISQIGGALEAAHEAGAVHGDLGPRCVVVTTDGDELSAQLAGFGRAEGNRLDDVRDLGSILGAMLGEPEGTTDQGLAAMVERARGDGFASAAELVSAVDAATGGSGAESAAEGKGARAPRRRGLIAGLFGGRKAKDAAAEHEEDAVGDAVAEPSVEEDDLDWQPPEDAADHEPGIETVPPIGVPVHGVAGDETATDEAPADGAASREPAAETEMPREDDEMARADDETPREDDEMPREDEDMARAEGEDEPLAGEKTPVADDDEQPEDSDDDGERPDRRGLALVGLLAVIAVVLVLVIGGGDDESSPPAPPTATDASQIADGSSSTTESTSTSEQPGGGGGGAPAPITVRGFPVGTTAREGVVYAATRDTGKLIGFDQGTGRRQVRPVDLGAGAEDVTVVDGVAWATLPDADAVARIDLGAAQLSAETFDVGKEPNSVIGALGSIWVTDGGSDELSQLPLEGGSAQSVSLQGSGPTGIAFGLGSLWVTEASGELLRVDPKDPTKQSSFKVGADPRGVLVAGNSVFVAESGDGTVAELDPKSGKIRRIEVGGTPRELGTDTRTLYVTNGGGYVTSIDLRSQATQQIDLSGAGGSPQGIAVDEQVWTTTGSGDSLIAVAPGR